MNTNPYNQYIETIPPVDFSQPCFFLSDEQTEEIANRLNQWEEDSRLKREKFLQEEADYIKGLEDGTIVEEEEEFVLTPEMLETIKKSQEEIENGLFYTLDEVKEHFKIRTEILKQKQELFTLIQAVIKQLQEINKKDLEEFTPANQVQTIKLTPEQKKGLSAGISREQFNKK